ncbi:TetR family transcriptional regulator [Rhodococcus coprophilus]|uniref:TetR family transcriptional regulator n=1 Tax=Rhodococcus coprophilus TaxID=38310 RepID=UPI0037B960A8
MKNTVSGTGEDKLLDTVVELLDEDGFDAVQLREVARRARISLSTIYKRYATRDELILAAIERWMEVNHSALGPLVREPGEALHPAMMRVMRAIFDPWERHPQMLLAYFRVRAAPGGDALHKRGFDPVVPVGMAVLSGVDPDFVAELKSILSSMVYGLVGRCRDGDITIADIMPTLDRTIYWLTIGYEATLETGGAAARP